MEPGLVIPLDDTWVLAESGPMRLQIAAWNGSGPSLETARSGGEWACGLLEELAPFQDLIKQKEPWPNAADSLPRVVREMIKSVVRLGDADLTPLGAVAGTISDLVAEHLFSQRMSKVIVNNGGDIAIRMIPEEAVRVGIRLDVSSVGFIIVGSLKLMVSVYSFNYSYCSEGETLGLLWIEDIVPV